MEHVPFRQASSAESGRPPSSLWRSPTHKKQVAPTGLVDKDPLVRRAARARQHGATRALSHRIPTRPEERRQAATREGWARPRPGSGARHDEARAAVDRRQERRQSTAPITPSRLLGGNEVGKATRVGPGGAGPRLSLGDGHPALEPPARHAHPRGGLRLAQSRSSSAPFSPRTAPSTWWARSAPAWARWERRTSRSCSRRS